MQSPEQYINMNNKTLKLFCQDCSWRGQVIAIAYSEEEARIIMDKNWGSINYDKDRPIESYDIVDGLVLGHPGDS